MLILLNNKIYIFKKSYFYKMTILFKKNIVHMAYSSTSLVNVSCTLEKLDDSADVVIGV